MGLEFFCLLVFGLFMELLIVMLFLILRRDKKDFDHFWTRNDEINRCLKCGKPEYDCETGEWINNTRCEYDHIRFVRVYDGGYLIPVEAMNHRWVMDYPLNKTSDKQKGV